MSWRRRRASTSSVETVDCDRIHWMQETSVVRSQPKDVSKDLYPCFELRDATVYDMNGESLENALNVVVRGPYMVRGYLIIDDPSQKSHLILPRPRASTPIEIRHCISYSIGEDESRPVVWVLGRGGWYEINPSEAYRPIFDKMCEATTMYYSLVDIFTSEKFSRTPARANANSIEALRDAFLQYAMKVGDGATFNEVVQRCAEHAIFFVCQFGQESLDLIDWKQTPFHRWFTTQHADVVRKTELALKNPRKPVSPARDMASPAPSHRPSTRNTRSLSIEIDADTVQLSKRPKPSPQADVGTPIAAAAQRPAIPTPTPDATMSPAAIDESAFTSVLNAIEKLYEEGRGAKKGITATKAANDLYFGYKFPNYKDGSPGSHRVPVEEVLHYYAAALLQVLDREKYQPHGLWTYLEELRAKPFMPRALKPSDFPYKLEPRKPTVRASKKAALGSGDPGSSPREDGAGASSDPRRHAGKTVKRPGRQPGKTSALRISASKKRAFAEIGDESEADSEASGMKRSHYFSDRDDEEEEEDVSMQDLGASRDGGLVVQPPSEDAEPIQILIRAEKVPSTIPRGPDDTWSCDQDGCEYIVRGGDAQACQVRIQRHFEEHDEQSKRLNLAVTESTRGHMPIKYAYFPPFLILAEMPPVNETINMTSPPSPPPPPAHTSYPSPESDDVPGGIPDGLPDDPPDDAPNVIPDLSGSATDSFRQLVAQFRRRPQPVSDRIPSLTLLQSSTREAQANGRKGAAGPAVPDAGRSGPVPDQEETDSVTLRLDDDDSDDDCILVSCSRR